MNSVIEKEEILTTIPEKTLRRLVDIQEYIMNDMVEDSLVKGENQVTMDIGFGDLTIRFEDNTLRFKFVPSAKFEESLINTIVNKENILKLTLEKTLVDKITHVYKDLI